MSDGITGGCLCGKVRYTAGQVPKIQLLCHCADCRKRTGSAFASGAMIPKDEFQVEGETKTHHGTGNSGNEIARIFCPECGSNLWFEIAARPDAVVVQVGTIDDPSWFRPCVNVWTGSALSWVAIDPDCKNFPGEAG